MSEGSAPLRQWQVSLAMPIEASGQAEAVAQFWEYVSTLGPDELPIFVSPYGDELSMHAYLGDHETDLDPEED